MEPGSPSPVGRRPAKPVGPPPRGFKSRPRRHTFNPLTISFYTQRIVPKACETVGQAQCVLSEEDAWEVHHFLYERVGSVRKLAEQLKVSKSSLHRMLKREQAIPVSLRARLCESLPPEELLRVLRGEELLRKYGIVDEEGELNKPLAFALLDAMLQSESTKEEVLQYLLKYYRQELTERLEGTLPKIELRWSKEFLRVVFLTKYILQSP